MAVNIDEVFEFALELAKRAGEKIKTAFNEPKKIDFKGQIDLVTETDKAVEEMVVNSIKAKWPNHVFVAEEVLSPCPNDLGDDSSFFVPYVTNFHFRVFLLERQRKNSLTRRHGALIVLCLLTSTSSL